MNNIELLHNAIYRLHGCEAVHIETILVQESFEGKVASEREVELFELSGPQEARQCYAWTQQEADGSDRHYAVLKTPPIDSAVAALRQVN